MVRLLTAIGKWNGSTPIVDCIDYFNGSNEASVFLGGFNRYKLHAPLKSFHYLNFNQFHTLYTIHCFWGIFPFWFWRDFTRKIAIRHWTMNNRTIYLFNHFENHFNVGSVNFHSAEIRRCIEHWIYFILFNSFKCV